MRKDKFTSVMYTCIAVLLIGIIALTGIGISYKFGAFNSGNSDISQEQPDTSNKPAKQYPIYVNYRLDGLGKDMSDYLECTLPAEATAGETVTFTVKCNSASYKITKVFYLYQSLFTGEPLTEINGVYSFVMPDEYVSVIVYFETAEYNLSWQIALSDLTPSFADVKCDLPKTVKVGETVNFTCTVQNSAHVVNKIFLYYVGLSSSPPIPCIDGIYSFIMPAANVILLIDIVEV